MQLYLVRHGQSSNNHLYDQTGGSQGRIDDPPLTDIGQQQAARVAQFLARPNGEAVNPSRDWHNANGFAITHVYASLMIRAVATGSAVARALGLPLVAWDDLHECGGVYLDDVETGEKVGQSGKERAYFAHHHPDVILPDGATERGWYNRPFETSDQCQSRAQRVVRDLLARHGANDDRVVMITHGDFYNHLLAALLNTPGPHDSGHWFVLNNVAITRIDFHDNRVLPVYLNRVDFLPRELVT
ncbi:MAG: histidine phosphatase family protein [Chloroflexota bacterium]